MREFSYPVGKEALDDIERIVRAPKAELVKARDALRTLIVREGTSTEIRDCLAEVLDLELSSALAAFMRGMRRNIDTHDFTIPELFSALDRGIQAATDREDIIRDWKEKEKFLRDIIQIESLHLSVKLQSILLSQNEHIHDISIICHILPLFDEERSSIVANVLKCMLGLIVSDRNETERLLEFPIGKTDLQRLIKQAENALKKIEVLERQSSSQNVPFVVYSAHP